MRATAAGVWLGAASARPAARATARTLAEERAMELLCRLSTVPAAVSDLLLDMETDRDDLAERVLTLRRARFDVIAGRVDGRRCLWIAESGWPAAERAAEGYWQRTHGE